MIGLFGIYGNENHPDIKIQRQDGAKFVARLHAVFEAQVRCDIMPISDWKEDYH